MSKYDSYDLFAHTDKHLTRLRVPAERDSRHFFPSEASVQFYNQYGEKITEGGCLRASYFRVTGGFEKIGNSAYSEYIFEMGKAVEKILIQKWKEMGIWVDSNVKFYDKDFNVSGELDVILAEPPNGTLYIAEVKSAYGYYAEREIFGNKSRTPYPKMGQLLQLLVYLYAFRDQFPYGRMVYFFRDSVKRRTFKVELHPEGNSLYPKIEGVINRAFTVNDVVNRYKELQGYIERQEVPPKDYELQYTDDKIVRLANSGDIGKTKYQAWQKGKLKDYEYVGDWNCRYCSYRKECWPQIVDGPNKDEQ